MALLHLALRLWGSLLSEGAMGLTLKQVRLWLLSSLGVEYALSSLHYSLCTRTSAIVITLTIRAPHICVGFLLLL